MSKLKRTLCLALVFAVIASLFVAPATALTDEPLSPLPNNRYNSTYNRDNNTSSTTKQKEAQATTTPQTVNEEISYNTYSKLSGTKTYNTVKKVYQAKGKGSIEDFVIIIGKVPYDSKKMKININGQTVTIPIAQGVSGGTRTISGSKTVNSLQLADGTKYLKARKTNISIEISYSGYEYLPSFGVLLDGAYAYQIKGSRYAVAAKMSGVRNKDTDTVYCVARVETV